MCSYCLLLPMKLFLILQVNLTNLPLIYINISGGLCTIHCVSNTKRQHFF